MSHDIEAAWAASEIARSLKEDPSKCFGQPPSSSAISVYAVRDSRKKWPVADGVIIIEGGATFSLGLEFKRVSEGLHGALMALGQAYAYIHRGFSAAVIAIPSQYPTHGTPAEYVSGVIDAVSPTQQIAVFSYDEPEPTETSPFRNRLKCVRRLELDNISTKMTAHPTREIIETQWAHLREGSSDPDAFFRYLQTAKFLDPSSREEPQPSLPQSLKNAIAQMKQGHLGPVKYLSNSADGMFHDRVWRHFWFNYVLTDQAIPIWRKDQSGNYLVNEEPSRILLPEKGKRIYKKFFAGRSDSVKNKIVKSLCAGDISEDDAWKEYANNIRSRAHSYREDIDSGLEHLGLLEPDGKPSDLGYRFVDACERTQDSNSGTPRLILGSAVLRNGQLGAFLYYVYRLSESRFARNPLAFAKYDMSHPNAYPHFDRLDYLKWLEDALTNDLRVMHKVSLRRGKPRRPFQGELAVLRHLGYVSDFRPGVGLVIN